MTEATVVITYEHQSDGTYKSTVHNVIGLHLNLSFSYRGSSSEP